MAWCDLLEIIWGVCNYDFWPPSAQNVRYIKKHYANALSNVFKVGVLKKKKKSKSYL